MAYIGLAYPIMARKRDGPEYYDGILVGKAVEAEITPNYIDTSGYTEMCIRDRRIPTYRRRRL